MSVFGEGAFCYTNLKSLTIQKFLFILISIVNTYSRRSLVHGFI